MTLFAELKRRNVFRVGFAYVVVSWLALQVCDVVLNNIEAPDWVFQAIMLLLAIGFPMALVFAWAYEMTPEGIKREKEVGPSGSITKTTGRKPEELLNEFRNSFNPRIAVTVDMITTFVLTCQGASAETPTNNRSKPRKTSGWKSTSRSMSLRRLRLVGRSRAQGR